MYHLLDNHAKLVVLEKRHKRFDEEIPVRKSNTVVDRNGRMIFITYEVIF